jgi:mono/diheme cytochrome c family protein
MNTDRFFQILALTGVIFGIRGITRALSDSGRKIETAITSGEVGVERGRHLIRISGCNDCHTPGFMEKGESIPETEWLTGTALGWRGPWGTNYPSNLRRQLAAWGDAGKWIEMIRARHGHPPMPWTGLRAMTDDELRSVHAYIRSLPVTGDPAPPTAPPDQEPKAPYLNLTPVMPL